MKMNKNHDEILTTEEKDILQEVMNIAFGQASADLAEVIDIHVILNVPEVETIKAVDMPAYIQQRIQDQDIISIVEQNYLGKFNGKAILIFPLGAGKELFNILSDGDQEMPETLIAANLAKDALLEVGNILIGACVGKVADLLDDVVTYTPPRVIIEEHPKNMVPLDMFEPDSTAIIMRTIFSFQGRDMNGYFFLINTRESLKWLKKALVLFLEKYL